MPQSMENYYQEAGRAGRDGENSQCIMLFSLQDIMINKFLLESKDFSEIDASDVNVIKEILNKENQIILCLGAGDIHNEIKKWHNKCKL
jgi:superfamily II DNA helicase RecQ